MISFLQDGGSGDSGFGMPRSALRTGIGDYSGTTGSNQWGSGWQVPQATAYYGGGGGSNFGYGSGGFGTLNPGYSSAGAQGPWPYNGGYQGNLFNSQRASDPTFNSPWATALGEGAYTTSTLDPALTNSLFGYLQSNVGQGLNAYPGQLSAYPMSMLQNPSGMWDLSQISANGMPFDNSGVWNSMIQAQQRQVAENAGNLQEGLGIGGALVGTPYGTTMSDYYGQTTKDENSLIAQLASQSFENAANRRLGAANSLMQGSLQQGMDLQNVYQNALDRQYQEWLRTQPEYNPLLKEQLAAAMMYPQVYGKAKGGGLTGLLGTLGGVGASIASVYFNGGASGD